MPKAALMSRAWSTMNQSIEIEVAQPEIGCHTENGREADTPEEAIRRPRPETSNEPTKHFGGYVT